MTRDAIHPDVTSPASPGERRRVLVSAFAVSPVRGSEPAGGWNLCLHLARFHDVTVLCAPEVAGEEYQREIEQYLRDHGPISGLTFHFVPRPKLSRLFQREGGSLLRGLYYVGYAAWQRAALAEAKKLHAQQPFDLVHHLNITGYREPGYLWKLDRRTPFVWGPVGGASDLRWSFLPTMAPRDAAFYALRNLANVWQRFAAVRPRRAARAASHVFVTSEDNRRLVRDRWRHPHVELLLDGGSVAFPDSNRPYTHPAQRPLHVVWTGLHIGRKALPILLQALQQAQASGPVQVTVLGGGPRSDAWRNLAQKLGVDHAITWTGQLSHEQAVATLAGADVLAFTSLQEGTPFAVLEALAMGLAVICHDACGMGIAVNDECGVKIPLKNPVASAAGFAAAIQRLRDDRTELRRLSAGARRRAAELSWPAKAAAVDAAYRRVWAERSREHRITEVLIGPGGRKRTFHADAPARCSA